MRLLELPLALPERTGEGPLLVAEKLRLDQALRECCAVHLDQGRAAAPAFRMQLACDELLAGTALAGDQDGGIEVRCGADHLEYRLHDGAAADDAPEGDLAQKLVAQFRVLLLQVLTLRDVAAHHEGPHETFRLVPDRIVAVFEDAPLDLQRAGVIGEGPGSQALQESTDAGTCGGWVDGEKIAPQVICGVDAADLLGGRVHADDRVGVVGEDDPLAHAGQDRPENTFRAALRSCHNTSCYLLVTAMIASWRGGALTDVK